MTTPSQDDLTAERAATCSARVYDRWRIDVAGHLCSKRAKVEADGKWYCGVHDPEAVKRRSQASYDRYQKQFENPLKYTEKDYQDALKTARQEALREAREKVNSRFKSVPTGLLGAGMQLGLREALAELDRLASEGA